MAKKIISDGFSDLTTLAPTMSKHFIILDKGLTRSFFVL